MSKKVDPTKLGIFVVVAFVLVVVAVALFGSGQMFKRPNRYVIVFSESVQGLNIGSPVRLKGIQLGTVVDIQAIFQGQSNSVAIPIYVEIDRERIKNLGILAPSAVEQQATLLKAGIRAQLVTDSIVTGQRAISLDFRPETPVRLANIDHTVPEISSIPSPLEEISETLQALPIQEIVSKFHATLTAVEQTVSSPSFTEAIQALGPTLNEVRESTAKISTELQPLIRDLRSKVDAFDAERIFRRLEDSLAAIDTAASDVSSLSKKGSTFDVNLNRALLEVAAAARELRELAEMLQRRPESLLTGKQ